MMSPTELSGAMFTFAFLDLCVWHPAALLASGSLAPRDPSDQMRATE